MRYLSLFSGIEAASVAWEPLGWEPVAFCEIDAFPSAVLAYHYPNVPNLGDITKVNWDEFKKQYGAIDIIVGGSPCQSFSTAGNRTGLDGESRLMYEYIRAVSEVRPTWFLWENVPGVFSTDAGRAFGILLYELEKLGYGMAWRVLDAQFFRVAQRRKRVFLVGYLGNVGCSTAVLFESESVRGNTKTGKEKREEITADLRGCSSIVCLSDNQQHSAIDENMVGTLKVGGDRPTLFVNSTGGVTVGALCARDAHAPSNQYVEQGKIICELNPDVLR